jgi:hypothetical protein
MAHASSSDDKHKSLLIDAKRLMHCHVTVLACLSATTQVLKSGTCAMLLRVSVDYLAMRNLLSGLSVLPSLYPLESWDLPFR